MEIICAIRFIRCVSLGLMITCLCKFSHFLKANNVTKMKVWLCLDLILNAYYYISFIILETSIETYVTLYEFLSVICAILTFVILEA